MISSSLIVLAIISPSSFTVIRCSAFSGVILIPYISIFSIALESPSIASLISVIGLLNPSNKEVKLSWLIVPSVWEPIVLYNFTILSTDAGVPSG